jgi:hypothetical protein
MQIVTQDRKRVKLLETKRSRLRKLLLSYINFLIKCLNDAETKSEVKRIIDSLKLLENKMWVQTHSNKALSDNFYLTEQEKIFKVIDNLYLPY